jgi:hypothetical protein
MLLRMVSNSLILMVFPSPQSAETLVKKNTDSNGKNQGNLWLTVGGFYVNSNL